MNRRDIALELQEVHNQVAEATGRAIKQAVREAMVLALPDIEEAVMKRLKHPLVVSQSGVDGSSILTVSFSEVECD